MAIQVTTSYSIGERILRTAVFQAGVGAEGLIERILLFVCSMFVQRTCRPKLFDPERAERGLQLLQRLGAQVEKINTPNSEAELQVITLNSQRLESILLAEGARWEKIGTKLAIIPPAQRTDAWSKLEEALLHVKWKKQVLAVPDKGLCEVIVTCENAVAIADEDQHKKLFLTINSPNVLSVMHTREAGFWLGCKQNVCLFDFGGSWKSSGSACEARHNKDSLAVFEHVKSRFDPQQIWISSACGGSQTAAFLKAKTHHLGTNLLLECGFVDLSRDFFDRQCWLLRKLAHYFKTGLSSKNPQDADFENNFNIPKKWENLQFSPIGKTLVVSVDNDPLVSNEVSSELAQCAQRINETVHLSFFSPLDDPHSDMLINHPIQASQALLFIFSGMSLK